MPVRLGRPRALALAAQADQVVGWLGGLQEADFDRRVDRGRPARGAHRVRDVAAHLVLLQDVLLRAISSPSLDEPRGAGDDAGALARVLGPGEVSADLAARMSGIDLTAELRASMDEFVDTLHRPDLPTFVTETPPAHDHALATSRLLAMHATAWVLHTLDLRAAGAGGPALDPRAAQVARDLLGETPRADEVAGNLEALSAVAAL